MPPGKVRARQAPRAVDLGFARRLATCGTGTGPAVLRGAKQRLLSGHGEWGVDWELTRCFTLLAKVQFNFDRGCELWTVMRSTSVSVTAGNL